VIGSEGDGYKIIGRRDQISDLIGKSE
jgi:hypothetical protein